MHISIARAHCEVNGFVTVDKSRCKPLGSTLLVLLLQNIGSPVVSSGWRLFVLHRCAVRSMRISIALARCEVIGVLTADKSGCKPLGSTLLVFLLQSMGSPVVSSGWRLFVLHRCAVCRVALSTHMDKRKQKPSAACVQRLWLGLLKLIDFGD